MINSNTDRGFQIILLYIYINMPPAKAKQAAEPKQPRAKAVVRSARKAKVGGGMDGYEAGKANNITAEACNPDFIACITDFQINYSYPFEPYYEGPFRVHVLGHPSMPVLDDGTRYKYKLQFDVKIAGGASKAIFHFEHPKTGLISFKDCKSGTYKIIADNGTFDKSKNMSFVWYEGIVDELTYDRPVTMAPSPLYTRIANRGLTR